MTYVRTYVDTERGGKERERERERERKQASKRKREKGREERKKAREKDRRKRDRVGMGADNEGTRAQSLGGLVLIRARATARPGSEKSHSTNC